MFVLINELNKSIRQLRSDIKRTISEEVKKAKFNEVWNFIQNVSPDSKNNDELFELLWTMRQGMSSQEGEDQASTQNNHEVKNDHQSVHEAASVVENVANCMALWRK